jgi:hypothetical protein
MKSAITRIVPRLGRRRRLVARLAPYRLGPMDPYAAQRFVKDVARQGGTR